MAKRRRYILTRMSFHGHFVDVRGYPESAGPIAFDTLEEVLDAARRYKETDDTIREKQGRRWEGDPACYSYRVKEE